MTDSYGGTIWSVWEHRSPDGTCRRWIGCDRLEYWTKYKSSHYKPLEEKSGPNVFTCPLGYLELVPEAQFPEAVD